MPQELADLHPFDLARGVADHEHDGKCLVGPVVGVPGLVDPEHLSVVPLAVPEVRVAGLELEVEPPTRRLAVVGLELDLDVDPVVADRDLPRDLPGSGDRRVDVADEDPLAALRVEHDLRRPPHLLDASPDVVAGQELLDLVPERHAALAVGTADVVLAFEQPLQRRCPILDRCRARGADVGTQACHARGLKVVVDVLGEENLVAGGRAWVAVDLELGGTVGLGDEPNADLVATDRPEIGGVPPQFCALEGLGVVEANDERRVDLVDEAAEPVRHEELWLGGPVRALAPEVAGEDEHRRSLPGWVLVSKADRPLDELLVHGVENDPLVRFRQPHEVLRVNEVAAKDPFLQDAASLVGIVTKALNDGLGVGVEQLGLEEHVVAESQSHDRPGPSEEPDHGVELVGLEGAHLSRQPVPQLLGGGERPTAVPQRQDLLLESAEGLG